MYEAHFGLRARPFAMAPDPDYLFLGEQHALGLTMLRYGVESGGLITVLTGDVGSGKTILVRALMRELGVAHDIGVLGNAAVPANELMRWTSLAFGLEFEGRSEAALQQSFARHLAHNRHTQRSSLLVIDEAQNLGCAALEAARLLTNAQSARDDGVRLLLIGQPELQRMLQSPRLRALQQRIGVNHQLRALGSNETTAYIEHRSRRAGAEQALFDAAAASAIHVASGGCPRAINALCESALMFAYATHQTTVDAQVVAQVLRERSPPDADSENACDNGALRHLDFAL